MAGLFDDVDDAGDRIKRDIVRRAAIKRERASSNWTIVLRVARSLPPTFTLNDLSVACHAAAPDRFGMRGHPQYPDNHRLHSILYGSRGLIATGHIARVRVGVFSVGPNGHRPTFIT